MASVAARRETGGEPDIGAAVAAAAGALDVIAGAAGRVGALAGGDARVLYARGLLQLTDAEDAVTRLREELEGLRGQLRRERARADRIAEEAVAAYLEDRRGGLRAV